MASGIIDSTDALIFQAKDIHLLSLCRVRHAQVFLALLTGHGNNCMPAIGSQVVLQSTIREGYLSLWQRYGRVVHPTFFKVLRRSKKDPLITKGIFKGFYNLLCPISRLVHSLFSREKGPSITKGLFSPFYSYSDVFYL